MDAVDTIDAGPRFSAGPGSDVAVAETIRAMSREMAKARLTMARMIGLSRSDVAVPEKLAVDLEAMALLIARLTDSVDDLDRLLPGIEETSR
jgi:hypothetical protein